MARDTFVKWESTGQVPSQEALRIVLEDYLGGVGGVVWSGNRFFVKIAGHVSDPLRRIPGAMPMAMPENNGTLPERYFEVFVGEDNIDVITRRQDDLTNAIATGFATICARFWRGRIESG